MTAVLGRPRVSEFTGEFALPSTRRAAPTSAAQAAAWLALHVAIAVAPLALCFTEVRPGRGFVINLSVALGFVALSVMGLQFALAARFTRATAPFGIDAVLRYHKQMSVLAVVAAFGHPLLLFLADEGYRVLLDVANAPLRARFAWTSVAALALLMGTSIWRRALRISYPVWHVLHSALGVTTVLAGLGHAFLVDYYLSETWVRAAVAGLRRGVPLAGGVGPPGQAAAALAPPVARRRAVAGARQQRHGRTRARPRHKREFTFQAGQFAWIMPGRMPFRPTYHPFSISSSALRPRLEFTIKQVGDFTRSIRRLKIGDTVYVDGPHGSFTLERHPGPGFVFLGAGVGVTPFLSMLTTLADQGDQRPCWLILGNRNEDQITGIRQLERLRGRVNLTVVHVISRASDEWPGERGRIDAALLDRHLPEHHRSLQYFICAREEMVHALKSTLGELDVPTDHVHAEEFGMV